MTEAPFRAMDEFDVFMVRVLFPLFIKSMSVYSFPFTGHAKFGNFTWPDMQKISMSCVGSLSLSLIYIYIYLLYW